MLSKTLDDGVPNQKKSAHVKTSNSIVNRIKRIPIEKKVVRSKNTKSLKDYLLCYPFDAIQVEHA